MYGVVHMTHKLLHQKVFSFFFGLWNNFGVGDNNSFKMVDGIAFDMIPISDFADGHLAITCGTLY